MFGSCSKAARVFPCLAGVGLIVASVSPGQTHGEEPVVLEPGETTSFTVKRGDTNPPAKRGATRLRFNRIETTIEPDDGLLKARHRGNKITLVASERIAGKVFELSVSVLRDKQIFHPRLRDWITYKNISNHREISVIVKSHKLSPVSMKPGGERKVRLDGDSKFVRVLRAQRSLVDLKIDAKGRLELVAKKLGVAAVTLVYVLGGKRFNAPLVIRIIPDPVPDVPDEKEEGRNEEHQDTRSYPEKLLDAIHEEKTVGGFRIKVGIVPALRYELAEHYEYLTGLKLTGKTVETEFGKFYKKHRSDKHKVLVWVELNVSHYDPVLDPLGEGTHYFIGQEEEFLSVKQAGSSPRKSKGGFAPKYQEWIVREYDQKGGVETTRRKLARIQSRRIVIPFSRVRIGGKEAIVVTVKNLFSLRELSDGTDGKRDTVDMSARQISVTGTLKDLHLESTSFRFSSRTRELPEPPEGFEELVARVGVSKDIR